MTIAEQIIGGALRDRWRFQCPLEKAEIFDIHNVAEYFYAQNDQEEWDVRTDFPCLAPPFPEFWMEFGRPSLIVSREHGVMSSERMPYRVGLLFQFQGRQFILDQTPQNFKEMAAEQAEILDRIASPEALAEITSVLDQGVQLFDIANDKWGTLSDKAQVVLSRLLEYRSYQTAADRGSAEMMDLMDKEGPLQWGGTCHIFLQPQKHSPVLGPIGWHTLFVDADGRVMHYQGAVNTELLTSTGWSGLNTLWFPGLMAISFCHCKNVVTKPRAADPKLVKRQIERGRRPLTFKVLEIAPMKTVLEKAGATSPGCGLKRALHICRGHFANYQDKGLFGKYFGRYWISQHVRGSIDAGAVVKHYSVNAPK